MIDCVICEADPAIDNQDRTPLTRDDIPPPSCYWKRSDWRRDVHALLMSEIQAAMYHELERLSDSKSCMWRGSQGLVESVSFRVIAALGLAEVFAVSVDFDPTTRSCNCKISLTPFEIVTYGPQDSLGRPS